MNTKEAGKIFGKSQKEIAALCSQGLIPDVMKAKGRWMLPDNLEILLSKTDIILMLKELLKIKNYGANYPINCSLVPDKSSCITVMNYLFRIGLIGPYRRPIKLESVKLTEKGLDLLFQKVKACNTSSTNLNFIGSINIPIGMIATTT